MVMLLATLFFGSLASWAFLFPENFNAVLPFYELRPMHVSAALFWILTGAVSGILHFRNELFAEKKSNSLAETLFVAIWCTTAIVIFVCYGLKLFGGREYWEFPPVLNIPILVAWALLMVSYYSRVHFSKRPVPQYFLMWCTGILFFLFTFIEQNLWNFPWFRTSYLKEVAVQWKANGAMVGAWNQMIYGTSLYIMVKISGNESLALNKKSYIFYFIGFANLIFNWGHHIYNLPAAGWIRDTSYFISMLEWILFISIVQDFRKSSPKGSEKKHSLPYQFIISSEYWVLANLLLALLMSIPAINRFTHGTHITVAHAMGTTIGINTMILLGSTGYIVKIDELSARTQTRLKFAFVVAQISLSVFWLSLIIAGLIKGYRSVYLDIQDFNTIMQPVLNLLKIMSVAGVFLLLSFGWIGVVYIKKLFSTR